LLAAAVVAGGAIRSADAAQEPLARISGSLLFSCGKDTLRGETDAYLKDKSGAVRRLTESQSILDVRWLGNDVVVVSSRWDFGDAIYRRSVATDPRAPGRRIAGGGRPARTPAVSASGTLAYSRLGEERSGRLFEEVVVARDGRRRALGRFRSVYGLFWIRGRLYAHVRSRGITDLVAVTRRTATRLGRHVGLMAAAPDGRVAFSTSGRYRYGVTVMRVDGSKRRTFRTPWYPLTWSPGGTRVLVGSRRAREIGLMDPDSGRVESLGPSGCGAVVSADWRR
jgi:hypothetical protein